MSKSKHERIEPADADLTGHPGIGTGRGSEELDGESTYQEDALSDTTPQGGIDPDQRGRTNK